jgi:hypothetical protein
MVNSMSMSCQKLTPERSPIEEELDLATFKAVWLGQQHHEYGKWP